MERNKMFPKINVFLMIILTLVTLAIYIPIWFLRRKSWLNHLSATEKLGSKAAIFVLVIFCISALFLTVGGLEVIDSLINIVGGITILILAFKVRRILHKHFNVKHSLKVRFSGVFTFLFTIFYLQYKINRLPKTQEVTGDVA